MLAETSGAPLTQCNQGSRISHPAADVQDLAASFRVAKLPGQQSGQVSRVKAIPDLTASAAEADILQRPARMVGMNPKTENALVGFSELAGAGEDAATIDMDW